MTTQIHLKRSLFKKNDIVLDPFSGSLGLLVVQACELGIHGIGVDISVFNSLIGYCKVTKYDLTEIQIEITKINNFK